jgi:hypothetical protein
MVAHRLVSLYCRGMATGTPTEYLNIKEGIFPASAPFGHNLPFPITSNFFTIEANGPINQSVVLYSKVRLDLSTLQIITTDTTFTTVRTYASSAQVPQNYGNVEGCQTAGQVTAYGNIDLTGTPFTVAATFVVNGDQGAGFANFSASNQIVDLGGGGVCGGIAPNSGPGDGTRLQLAFF